MTETESQEPLTDSASEPAPEPSEHRTSPPRWPLYIFMAAFVFIPFLFWKSVWFGSTLSDEQIMEKLADREKVRSIQHAVSQLSQRIQADPESAKPFYPAIADLTDHPHEVARAAAAWLMGQDNTADEFRAALLILIDDPHPYVRYNSALSLSKFAEERCRPVLRNMLGSYIVTSPISGQVVGCLSVQDSARPGSQLALVDREGEREKIQSPLYGTIDGVWIKEGSRISEGEQLFSIRPTEVQVWETLRAMMLIGGTEELPLVEAFAAGRSEYPPQVQAQAQETIKALQERIGKTE